VTKATAELLAIAADVAGEGGVSGLISADYQLRAAIMGALGL